MSSRIKIADKAGGSNVMRLQMSSGPDRRCLVDLGKNPILNSILRYTGSVREEMVRRVGRQKVVTFTVS